VETSRSPEDCRAIFDAAVHAVKARMPRLASGEDDTAYAVRVFAEVMRQHWQEWSRDPAIRAWLEVAGLRVGDAAAATKGTRIVGTRIVRVYVGTKKDGEA
jgi:hypothetical protein